MGQQQLLLLVLSTVIVGLATVAGIQAFSENQAQASQDALTQRGISIASDVQGIYGKPRQMGGVDDFEKDVTDASALADRLGYEDGSSGGSYVDAEGAGADGECQLSIEGTDTVDITCTSTDSPQDVTVSFDGTVDEPISTSYGSGSGSK